MIRVFGKEADFDKSSIGWTGPGGW